MSNKDLIQCLWAIPSGTGIPKPQAHRSFVVKRMGMRAGQDALIYLIPNHKTPSKPYQKGVTISEWVSAYERLASAGEFTRNWFDLNLPRCAREGGCNFTTIGGVFSLLGIASYDGRGSYRAT
jgi:hypothetical protein